MVFKAKTDGFRWAIIGFVFLVFTGVDLLIYFTEGETQPIRRFRGFKQEARLLNVGMHEVSGFEGLSSAAPSMNHD